MNMVSMVMGIQNTVDVLDAVCQALLPEIGGRVDQDMVSLVLNQNRRPEPFIPEIVGEADFTIAA